MSWEHLVYNGYRHGAGAPFGASAAEWGRPWAPHGGVQPEPFRPGESWQWGRQTLGVPPGILEAQQRGIAARFGQLESEWFYLWREQAPLTDNWIFTGYFYGSRFEAQMLASALLGAAGRITDSLNYDVGPYQPPPLKAPPKVVPPFLQALIPTGLAPGEEHWWAL